jgi:glycine/serine hydroxymethyltransferase
VSITGKFWKSVPYGVRESDHRIDLDQVRALAREHRPKLIWCGTTAYPRTVDFAAFRASPTRWAPSSRRTSRTSPGLVAAARTPRRWASPTW